SFSLFWAGRLRSDREGVLQNLRRCSLRSSFTRFTRCVPMSRTSRFAGGALACWVALTGAALGQAQQREERPGEARVGEGERGAGARRAKSVLGAKISIKGGLAIGTVDDIIFNDDGYIDYVVVLNEGKYVLVPWEAAKFDFDKRTATVEITQERFREVPTFTMERWPNVYEPAYRERIYGFYGLRPGQQRRIHRREGTHTPWPPQSEAGHARATAL